MNRIRDYAAFAAWFAGLGYIVLWPVTAADLGGKPFGASIFCRDGAPSLADFLCHSAQPLHMPPGLHVLGFLSALFVTTRLMVLAFRRKRHPPVGPSLAVFAPPSRKPAPPRRAVKPRSQFGLRGVPQRASVLEKDDA